MKKLLPILLVPCIALGATNHSYAYKAHATKAGISFNVANAGPVSGTVKDETGSALPGVSVKIKGTNNGTQTDGNGHFKINANPGDVLVFTYVGYNVKEVTVGNSANYEVSLTPNSKNLNEVVVTALGITKSQASLTYDQQTVSGKELETVKDPSFVNSLNGKVAGLDIEQSSSGAGGSTKVVLRGNKSIYGNNNVLYVVDGIPLNDNTSGQPNGPFAYGADGGDGISNINPDDIESISVLKGASASALYGSAAANGVVLITTKKGKAGKTIVDFNAAESFQKATYLPKFQSEYAQGDSTDKVNPTSTTAWGPKQSADYYDVSKFFQTGNLLINSLAISTGTDKNQTFVSYANTFSKGIEPVNSYYKNNFTIRNTSKFWNDKLTLDVSANYIDQKTKDRPTSGTYFNPIWGLYMYPRGANFEQYSNYEVYNPSRNINVQNWPSAFLSDGFSDNPYWVQNRDMTTQAMNRILGSMSLKYDIADWINLQVRGKLDKADFTNNQDIYATSIGILSSAKGNYNFNQTTNTQVYSDVLLNINKKINSDFAVTGTLGASIQDNEQTGWGIGSNSGLGGAGLETIVNYFNLANVDLSTASVNQTNTTTVQTQSLFFSADLSFKNQLYLDVTGRNDWTSTLAYTNTPSFFYPSFGLSDVLSRTFKMPDFVSFSKVRVSYAQVGNGLPSYLSTEPVQYSESNGHQSLNPAQPFTGLKPESTHSWEIGTEWHFFNDHMSFDATYYHTNTYNQLFNFAVSTSTGYSSRYINAGNVENSGFEGTLGYNGKIGSVLGWNSTVTFALNRNKVISLFNDPTSGAAVTRVQLPSAFDSYSLEVRDGKPYGEIYARDFLRDASGKLQTTGTAGTSTYAPLLEATNPADYTDVGNSNPNFLLGWNNTFKLANFDLSFLVDGRFGGKVVDMTQAYLDANGDSQASAIARDNGGVTVDGDHFYAKTYYGAIGSRQGALAQYAYSATNVRLREASFGYTFPGKMFGNTISNLHLALTARNLFFFYLKAPYDPDIALSTDNGLQGIDLFGQPSVRSFGFNLSARF